MSILRFYEHILAIAADELPTTSGTTLRIASLMVITALARTTIVTDIIRALGFAPVASPSNRNAFVNLPADVNLACRASVRFKHLLVAYLALSHINPSLQGNHMFALHTPVCKITN